MNESEHRVLSDLLEIITQMHVPTLAIGANARRLILDQPHKLPAQRLTLDWDFETRVESWLQYRALAEQLVARGKFGKTSTHSFVHIPTDIPVDIVPFGKIAGRDATTEWPETERRMSVLGFETALERAEEVDVAGRRLKVASPPWHVALKLIAYADRALEKDLLDVDFILEHATSVQLERVYEALTDELANDILDYDEAGAYLIGADLAAQASEPVVTVLTGVLARLLEDSDHLELKRHLARHDEAGKLALIVKRFRALRGGLS